MPDGILPAAGLASRMRGLPKFLLPCDDSYTTLIERHITKMLDVCETVWIPTRPEQTILLESLGLSSDRVVIVPMITSTMTETVVRISGISGATRFMLIMPDTYFHGQQPYEFLAAGRAAMDLACWVIRPEQLGKLGQVQLDTQPVGKVLASQDKDPNCAFPHSWGAMSFEKASLVLAKPNEPHTGYVVPKLLQAGAQVNAMVMDGSYFDCGTPSEYLEMLSLVTQPK